MARSKECWNNLYSTFQPSEVLMGERNANLYCKRENSPFEHMRINLRSNMGQIRPPIIFFTGHRGSGKSSTLFRLIDNFKHEFFIVYFDIGNNLDQYKADQIDLLYILGATIFKVAKDENINPDNSNLGELIKSIYTITETKKETVKESIDFSKLINNLVCFGASMIGGTSSEKIAKALLKPFNSTKEEGMEISRTNERKPQAPEIINNINLIIGDVETKASKPLLVVVDGLDKLPNVKQAESIFLRSRALLGPICRIIYTVPMSIYKSPDFEVLGQECKSYMLPNIKLYDKNNHAKKYSQGYEIMRAVIEKRLKLLDIQPTDIFDSNVIDLLIQKSGGILRFLIELVNNSFEESEIMNLDRVSSSAAQKAINRQTSDLTVNWSSVKKNELRYVHKNKLPFDNKISNELLHKRLIVTYRDNETWFDAHPLIWNKLKIGFIQGIKNWFKKI